MKITELSGRRRPGPRKSRRQAAATRARTAVARRQLAATGQMLGRRKGSNQ